MAFHHGAFQGQRGYYNNDAAINEARMMDLIQDFRSFRPILNRIQSYLGTLEHLTTEQRKLQDDVKFYLDVMKDILADDSHGEDQIRSYIDKLHDIIRKNPIPASFSGNRRSIDDQKVEFNDDDRPRSPSPGARGSDGVDKNVPLIPTHGAHRTVEVNFSEKFKGEPSSSNHNDGFDEFKFTRQEPFTGDVDMRGNFFGCGPSGRGQRRFNEDHDFGAGRGLGRGSGRGAPLHKDRDDEWNPRAVDFPCPRGRGRGLLSKDYDNRTQSGRFHPERERMNDSVPNASLKAEQSDWRNEEIFDEWNPAYEKRLTDEDFNKRQEFRKRQEEEKMMKNPPPHIRPRYPPPVNQMRFPHPPPMGQPFGIHPHQPRMYSPNPGPGLLPTPTPPYGHQSYPPPPPNAFPPRPPGGPYNMGYHYPPPHSSPPYGAARPGVMPTPPPPPRPSGYHIPPPQMPSSVYGPPPHHSNDNYQNYSNYNTTSEPSKDELRDISLAKAKNCFNNNRPPQHRTTNRSLSPVTSAYPPKTPTPPSPDITDLGKPDPRTHRGNNQTPAVQPRPPQEAPMRSHASTSRPDAGNVLRPSSDHLRHRNTADEQRKLMNEAKERVRQKAAADAAAAAVNKPSKLTEIRRKLEKEMVIRPLGRDRPKKQSGSFEDALSAAANSSETSNNIDKSKTSLHTKDSEVDHNLKERSQSDKTDRERSLKKSEEINSSKGKSKHTDTDGKRKKKLKRKHKDEEETDGKKSSLSKHKKKKSVKKSVSFESTPVKSTSSEKSSGKNYIEQIKPPAFKIPRKPKLATMAKIIDKTSQPDSPEPALSEGPDADSRSNDDNPPQSSKSTSQATVAGFELLKQFVLANSCSDEDRSDLLNNPEKLNSIITKVMKELKSDGGTSGEASLTQNTSNENDKTAAEAEDKDDEESTPTRGRSREKKRNTKRRSSLEKLHDALKEMKFDTMLPLGPRRCTTRGESASEEAGNNHTDTETSEPNTSSVLTSPGPETKPEESQGKAAQTKKRGRPLKSVKQPVKPSSSAKTPNTKKGKKGGKALPSVGTARNQVSEARASPPQKPITPKGKGTKRKIKVTKTNPTKRVKKSGPVTRAQAALRKSRQEVSKPREMKRVDGVLENATGDAPKRVKKSNSMMLRRINRNRKHMGAKDSTVNKGLCKVKLEKDYIAPTKAEPNERDQLNLSDEQDIYSMEMGNYDTSLIADLMNERLSEGFPTGEIDLTVFNTISDSMPLNQVIVKDEVDLDADGAELPYDSIINGTSPSKSGKRTSNLPSTTTKFIEVIDLCSPVKQMTNTDNANAASPHLNTIQMKEIESPLTRLSLTTETESRNDESTTNPESVQNNDSSSVDNENATPQPLEKPEKSKAEIKKECLTQQTSDDATSDPFQQAMVEDEPVQASSSNNSSDLPSSDSSSDIIITIPLVSTPEPSVVPQIATGVESNQIPPIKTEVMDAADSPEKIKCELCNFAGKKIVSHYVNKHHPCDIPQARLEKATFDGLVEMNASESLQLLEIALDQTQEEVWPCLYCDCRFRYVTDFYDHLTTHTGEFRFECIECGSSYPFQKSLVNHIKTHKGVTKNCVKIRFASGIDNSYTELTGYLCSDCYYFQLRFENIMRHLDKTSHNGHEVKSVKLILQQEKQTNNKNKQGNVCESSSTSGCGQVKQEIVEAAENDNLATSTDNGGMLLENDTGTLEVDKGLNDEVFFGTNISYSSPKVSPNEIPPVIAPVFQSRFLDAMLKKVTVPNPEEISIDDDDDDEIELFRIEECVDSKKRKRSGSFFDDDELSQDSNQASLDENPEKRAKLPKNLNFPDLPVVRKRYNNAPLQRVCILKKMRSRARTKCLELNAEEPNNFYTSSDESSDESSLSDDSDDDSLCRDFDPNKVKHELLDSDEEEEIQNAGEGYLRSNEHLIKTKTFHRDKIIDSYMDKRNLTVVRRPGDLYAPNTVLYGYVNAAVISTSRLRDHKESDRLGGVHGKRVLPMKGISNLEEMLTREKLMHLYKCMGTYCSFTSDDPAEFLQHLNIDHVPIPHGIPYAKESCARFVDVEEALMMKDADCCAYCSARYKHHKDLVNHVTNQHSQSLFQCNKCFYRAYYQRYVVRHFDVEHPDEDDMHIFKCQRNVQAETQEATLFQIFVYKCNVENTICDKSKRFVFREDFMEHLEECCPHQELYPCHLCKSQETKGNLLEHYKTHNLFKFHCSYCPFGSEIKTDLDEHFVHVHPNTSGRVFYRVKPSDPTFAHSQVVALGTDSCKTSNKGSVVAEHTAKGDDSKSDVDNSANSERDSSLGGVDEEDGEKGRVTNLKGRELYRCVTGGCSYLSDNSERFKEHVMSCEFVTDSRSLACAHCERKLKTVTNLLEHMKVHGEKKQVCSICSFRCYTSTEITKHIKTVHRVMSYKLIKKDATDADVDPDVVAFPKDVFVKSLCDIESFENNYYLFTRKAVFSFENIDKLPSSKIFGAELYCAMCSYSTKVRTNMVRHLGIHKQALEDGRTIVPQVSRVNPVPYLSREGLEFDKMMNLAASSHKSEGSTTTTGDVKKLPQFVKEQFRYVCSVCNHMTMDEGLLQTHIRVIHSEVTSYKCPHCQKNPETKDNPDYNVPLEKIQHHLRLHGPKLYKCGHCMVVHHQLRLMEKHIPEKHPEKKPIHYLIRDVDPEGVPSTRPSTSANRRQSVDDQKLQTVEKWRCFLCSSKSVFSSWEETKSHCEGVHKVNSQFMCLVCSFVSDDVTDTLTHCRENCKSEEKNKILVMFSKCQPFEGEDATINMPVWKKHGGAVQHIHGNFTEDSLALIKQYNSQQGGDQATPSPLKSTPIQITSKTNQMKPTTSSGAKARRSVGGIPKAKTSFIPPATPPLLIATQPKPEQFKFRCHKCDIFKSKNPNDLRTHLYNEFSYKRWKCLTCMRTFTTEKSLKGHIERDHQKVYTPEEYTLGPENTEIESEINEAIEKQNRKKDFLNSYVLEKQGKITCRLCKQEDEFTYETLETHILQHHSSATS